MVTHGSFQLEGVNLPCWVLLLGLYKLCSLASDSGTCQKLQVSHKLQILSLADSAIILKNKKIKIFAGSGKIPGVQSPGWSRHWFLLCAQPQEQSVVPSVNDLACSSLLWGDVW